MRSHVTALVLAHLGVAACGGALEEPGPPPVEPAEAERDTPPTAATANTPRGAAPRGCEAITCAPAERCVEDADGVGACTGRIYKGRPLVVDDLARVAAFTAEPAATTDAEVAYLRAAAQDEHASVAAFARTIAELMALGAPLSLLLETQGALADELRHTEMTLAQLERLTGERPRLGALDAAVAPLARTSEAFFRDVVRGGAVGETLAAAEAEGRRDATDDPELRVYFDQILHDEARHAALAFKTLRWLLDREPALAAALADELARLAPAARTLTAPLFATLAA